MIDKWLQTKYKISSIEEYRSELCFNNLSEDMIKIELINLYSEFVDDLENVEF